MYTLIKIKCKVTHQILGMLQYMRGGSLVLGVNTARTKS